MFTSSHWGTYSLTKSAGGELKAEGFPHDPEPSPLGGSLLSAVDSELRIQQPMVRSSWLAARRKGGYERKRRAKDPFVALSWSEAFELVAQTLGEVIEQYGNSAIFGGSYGWASAGRFHHAQSQLHRFLNLIGGYTASVNTYSSGAAEVIVPHVLGYDYRTCNDATTTWNVLAEHTQLVVAFGGLAAKNTQVHPGGISRHLASQWLFQSAHNGTGFVNVSPLRSDMDTQLGAQWLAVRPNTDSALMLALAHTLVVEALYDDAFVHSHCVGFEEVRDYLLGTKDDEPKTPEWAAALTDIDAQAIRDLARRMASQRTFITLSLSIQRGDHGEQAYWAGITLAALLGQIGLPGGGVGFGYAALGGIGNPRSSVQGPTFPQTTNPLSSFIPVARVTDMLLHPAEPFDYNGRQLSYPDIKLVYWAGGNPFHHQQDLARLSRAWQQPNTVIAQEIWWNPLARHADIVLPVTTTLERNDLGFNSADAYLIAMKQAVAPIAQAKSDFEIFAGIAQRMHCSADFTEGLSEMQWLSKLYSDYRERQNHELPEFEEFWAGDFLHIPAAQNQTIFLSDYRDSPANNPLPTPSGKIELYSDTIAGFDYVDCPGQACWMEPAEWLGSSRAAVYPLHLLSNQPAHRLHSQLDQAELSRASKVAGHEPMTMHPADARARGIEAGDVVRVFNDRGACLAGAVVSEELRRGVVQIATGAWFDPLWSDAGDVELDRGGNPNMLTLDKGTSRLAQATSAQTALVDVERYTGSSRKVQSYQPPQMQHKANF